MKKIVKALDLNPDAYTDEIKSNVPAIIKADDDVQAGVDLDIARDGIHDALAKSRDAVDDLIDIARQSQHPKAYEILNSAIKTLADISMSVADLQIKKQKITSNKDEGPTTVNNNLFLSTADLLKMIENKKADDK